MTFAKLQTINLEAERKHIFALFGFLLLLLALYMYFVSLSVVHVVIRQEAQQGINKLQTEISQLEAQFIQAQHAVSAEIASLDGYQETESKIFIDRGDDTLVLSASADR